MQRKGFFLKNEPSPKKKKPRLLLKFSVSLFDTNLRSASNFLNLAWKMELFQICSRPHPHSTLAVIPANADNVGAGCARRAAHDARLSTGLGARWSDTHQERGQGGLRLELAFICGGDRLIDFLFPRWKDYRWKFLFFISNFFNAKWDYSGIYEDGRIGADHQ